MAVPQVHRLTRNTGGESGVSPLFKLALTAGSLVFYVQTKGVPSSRQCWEIGFISCVLSGYQKREL